LEQRPDIYGILGAFSQKKLGQDRVMRGLMTHDGWLAPAVTLAPDADGNVVTDNIVMYGTETRLPPGEMWLFTERCYAQAAHEKGGHLGALASDLRGVDVFSNVPVGMQKLLVNPGSRPEEGWFLGSAGAIQLGRVWAAAVNLEQRLIAPDALEVASTRARLKASNELLAIQIGPSGLATMNHEGSKWLILFTAPDYAELFLDVRRSKGTPGSLAPAQGEKVFGAVAQLGLAGIYLNPATSGACPVSLDMCARIASETASYRA